MENFAMALTIFGALSLSVCVVLLIRRLDGERNV